MLKYGDFKKMKIFFIGKVDPWSSLPCGIRGYILGILKPFLRRKIDITIVGTTTAVYNSKDFGFTFIDVLEGNKKLLKFQAFFNIALYFKSLRLKSQGFFSDFDIIHAHRIDLALPFVFFKKPVICTLHGKATEQAFNKHGTIIFLILVIIERLVISRIDFMIAVSKDIQDYYIQKFPWISDKITVINTGVDTSIFKPRDKNINRFKFGFGPEEKIILYLGRFHEEKNLTLLITSFDHLVHSHKFQARLVLVGEGDERDRILDLIREKNLERMVSILKPIADSEVPEIMSCADVFGLSSVIEGFPLVILQALASDIPVVSTDVGEVSRVVIDNMTGFLVRDFSSETFADRLHTVLVNTERFRGKCVTIARNYTWENVADKTIEVYLNVLAKRSKQI
jgi:L-malate glycosyltransferase